MGRAASNATAGGHFARETLKISLPPARARAIFGAGMERLDAPRDFPFGAISRGAISRAALSAGGISTGGTASGMSADTPATRVAGNLCATRQSRMLRFGVLCFSVSLAAAIAFAKADVAPQLRWLLAVPFFLAVVGVSESLLQTCPFMALRCMRDHGDGMEPVADPRQRAELRARGKRFLLVSAAIALSAAGLFAELPL